MILSVLGSGSKGNSYLLQSPTGTLLLECGLSHKEIIKGLNFNLGEVVGCVVTHAHQDHCKGAKDLMKLGIDIFTSKETIQALGLIGHRVNGIEPLKQFTIGDFNILSFPTEHDIEGSLGFLIQYKPSGEKLLFITDSFYSKYKFNVNYLMIECNYIKETLDQNIEDGFIDGSMKPRLLQSHMSLENCKKFLQANDLSQCQEIVLLHLSNANSNADQMIREIYIETGIMPKIASKGLEVELEMCPY